MNVQELIRKTGLQDILDVAGASTDGMKLADQLPCYLVFKGDISSGPNKKGGQWNKTRIGVADSPTAGKDETVYLTVWTEVKANKGESIILEEVTLKLWQGKPSLQARNYSGGSVSAPTGPVTFTPKGGPQTQTVAGQVTITEHSQITDYQRPDHPTKRKSIEHQSLFQRACELAMFEVSKGAAAGTKVDSDLLGLKVGFWFDAVKGIFYGTADSAAARKQAEPQAEPEDDLLSDI